MIIFNDNHSDPHHESSRRTHSQTTSISVREETTTNLATLLEDPLISGGIKAAAGLALLCATHRVPTSQPHEQLSPFTPLKDVLVYAVDAHAMQLFSSGVRDVLDGIFSSDRLLQ